jgi:hypothetical protein
MPDILHQLQHAEEPAVRAKVMVNVLGLPEHDPSVKQVREAVRQSERVAQLLSLRDEDGKIPGNPYAKFTGAHWVLSLLADMEYPPSDLILVPLRDQVLDMWLDPSFLSTRIMEREPARMKSWPGVPVINGRARRCASQHGNALYAVMKLGLTDERVDELVELLIKWQWPDGGWNCDRQPEAHTSSFMESLTPLRALALHGKMTGNPRSQEAARRAAEPFLQRKMYRRLSDGTTMNENFVKLHYPCYWHYDILFGLKVMAEAGFINDSRCADAVDLLLSKRLADGGFPAEGRFDKSVETPENGGSLVTWGGVSKRKMNEFVSADALFVLHAARLI